MLSFPASTSAALRRFACNANIYRIVAQGHTCAAQTQANNAACEAEVIYADGKLAKYIYSRKISLWSGRFCTRLRLLCGLGLRDGDLQKGLNVQLAMMSVVLVSLCPIYPIFSISKNTFLAPFSQPAQVYTAGCCRDGLFAIELVTYTLGGAPELE